MTHEPHPPEDWHAEFQTRFDGGDASALLQTIRFAIFLGCKIPEWAATAFAERFDSVFYDAEANSWDAAFGKPFPKGTHISDLRVRRGLVFQVYSRVREIREIEEPGAPLDDGLFERVGNEFGIGKTLAKELWSSMQPKSQGCREK